MARAGLEDVAETSKTWTPARAALPGTGQFNGAYLVGRPLPPAYPWLCRGRTLEWAAAALGWEGFAHYAASAGGRSWLSAESVKRMRRLLGEQERILALLRRLPVCLCHHDTYRRNLLACDRPRGEQQTVAVDWSMVGYGGAGEGSGILTAATLTFLDVPGAEAAAFDDSIFTSYLAGLCGSRREGDARLAAVLATRPLRPSPSDRHACPRRRQPAGTPAGVAFTEAVIEAPPRRHPGAVGETPAVLLEPGRRGAAVRTNWAKSQPSLSDTSRKWGVLPGGVPLLPHHLGDTRPPVGRSISSTR